MKGVDYAPGAAAAILDWVEVDEDSNSTSSEYYRIKVFTEEGKKYADVEVPYMAGYPVKGRVSGISARTIQPDGTIVPFDGKVYDKVLYRSGGVRLRAKTFSLAGVQPGSILEYRYQRSWSESMLFNTLWTIQREIPVLRAKMTLKPYDSEGQYRSFFTFHNLPPGKSPVKVRDHFELELMNVPAFEAEGLAPPEETLKSRVNFYYTSDQVKPEQFWKTQTIQWSKTIESFIGKPDVLRPAVQSLTGNDAMETLRNVYAKAQALKNLSFEDETTAKEKKNAAEVLSRGEGYRDEINRTFVALARAAGLDAYVMRVAPRDRVFFLAQIPDAEQMSGEVAMVTIGGKTIHLDPGTPGAPFGMVSWEKSATAGYRIAKRGGTSELVSIEGRPPEEAILRRKADLRLNGETIDGTITVTFAGQEALVRRLRFRDDDEAARTKKYEEEVKAWFPDGATVKLKQLTGAVSHEETVVATFDVTLANLISSAGSRTLVPLSVFASTAKNPFTAVTRTHPIYFQYPRREEDEVKLTLSPELVPAALPAGSHINAGAIVYMNETRRDSNVLTYTRSLTVDTMMVDVKHYGTVRSFFSQVAAADQKPLVLVEKKP